MASRLQPARERAGRLVAVELVAVAAAALVGLAWLRAVLASNEPWLIHQLPDDAAYYLEIGQRIAAGEGATFDGVHATNGFHPLWQVLVALLGLGFDGFQLARAALVVGLLLMVAAFVLLRLLLLRAIRPEAATVAACLAFIATVSYVLDGMETALSLLAVVTLLVAVEHADRIRTTSAAVAVGAASAFVVLARLDNVVIVAIVVGWLFLRWRELRPMAAATGTGIVLVLPYVVWNLIRFGHLLSVSGTVKQELVRRAIGDRFGSRFSAGYLRSLGCSVVDYGRSLAGSAFGSGVLGVVLAVSLLICAVAAWRGRRLHELTPASSAARVLLVGLVAVAAKAVFDLVLSPFWAGESWYSGVPAVALALAWSLLLVEAVRRVPMPARPALVTLAAVLVAVHAWQAGSLGGRGDLDPTRGPDADVLAARWIATQGPAGTYGAPDAGYLGLSLHGKQRLVNLDGLVNDYDYAALLRNRPPQLDRLRAAGIDFYVARIDDVLPYQRFDHLPPPPCARKLWESPAPVPFRGDFSPQRRTSFPVTIWDVRPCGRTVM